MGGIPAGGTGPPPPARLSSRAAGGATGTSSSAVKSIVAACSVRASFCSITANRHARRPSSAVASSPTARSSRAAALREFGCLFGGCGSADTRDAGHRVPLTARDRGQRGAKPTRTQPCCPLRFAGCPPLLGEQVAAAECQRYARSSTSAAIARCKARSSTHYRGTITPRVRLAHQQVLQQRFTQEQHAVDAP